MSTPEPSKIVSAKICPRCSREFSPSGSINVCPHDQSLLSIVVVDPFVGTVIAGHYRVTEVLGQGGWSVVYKAHHETINNRQVAIKILHSHLVRDKDKVLRFQREAEAAMSLTHPQVASVYDYGVLPEGQPFIVMEYLSGIALSDVIQERGALPIEEALAIGKQVCLGLSNAHERNVIHRDIKPSNIFLTKDGNGDTVVKILDFGLAKIMTPDEAEKNLTQTGETMGTPDYMSPEQCLGMTLDARTDIYTLGYVMYEMLTGKQAVQGKNTYESMNLHIYEMPPAFGQANPNAKVPDLIEAAVFKALEKNPDNRYQTALEFRDALERAAAQKEHALDSFRKMLWSVKRRNLHPKKRQKKYQDPIMIAVSCVVAVAAAAIVLKTIEVTNTQKAQQQLNVTGNAAESWKSINALAIHAFNEGDYQHAREYFEQADKVAQQIGQDSAQRLSTLKYLKETYTKLGLPNLIAKVDADMHAVDERYYFKDYGRKEENDAKIRKLFKELLGNPKDKKIATALAETLNNQSVLAISQSQLKEAQDLVEQAIDVETRVLGKESAEYAKSLSNVACISFDLGKKDDAEKYYKQALAIRERVLGPNSTFTARSCRNLAEFYRRIGKTKETIPLLQRALKIYEKAVGVDSNDYAWTANNLGISYMALGEYESAEQWLKKAEEIRARVQGKDHVDYGRVQANLGQMDCLRGDYDRAEAEIKDALRIFENTLGPTSIEYGLAASNLGEVYLETNKLDLAEKYYRRALSDLRACEPLSERTIFSFQRLIAVLQKENKLDEARALTREIGDFSEQQIKQASQSRPIDLGN